MKGWETILSFFVLGQIDLKFLKFIFYYKILIFNYLNK